MSILSISSETFEQMRREYRADKEDKKTEENRRKDKKQIINEVAKARKTPEAWVEYVKRHPIINTPEDAEDDSEGNGTWKNVNPSRSKPIKIPPPKKGGIKTKKSRKSRKSRKIKKTRKYKNKK